MRLSVTRLFPVVLLLATAACGGGSGNGQTSPTTSGGAGTSTASLAPAPAVVLADRVTFYAADAGDAAGAIIAGDFNGDGVKDVIVTAPSEAGPGGSRAKAGAAYVFLGPFRPGETRDAAKGESDAVIYGANAGDELGRSVATGDFNGDGIDDIILGAPFAGGPQHDRANAGGAYVIFGSKRLGKDLKRIDLAAPNSADLTVFGAEAGDFAGFTVKAADFNRHGRADLVVGAFYAPGASGQNQAGRVYIINAGRTGEVDLAAGRQDATIYGPEAGARLGESVAVGDVNGDGVPDLIAGAAFTTSPDGKRAKVGATFIIYGPPAATVDTARGQQNVAIYGIDQGDEAGHSLAAGDANGDGFADILIGAVSAAGKDDAANLAGEAYLVDGGARLPSVIDLSKTAPALTVYGAHAKDRLGRSVAMGDVNGDGLGDLLISAPDTAAGELSRAGEVYIFYGRRAAGPAAVLSTDADLVLQGLHSGDLLAHEAFGWPPLMTTDMNGDGLADILVTAPQSNGPDGNRTQAGGGYLIFIKKK